MNMQETDARSQEANALVEEMRRLRKSVDSSVNLRRTFMMGLVSGVGTAIGATVIASVVLVLGFRFLKAAGVEPLLQSLGIDQAIEARVQQLDKVR